MTVDIVKSIDTGIFKNFDIVLTIDIVKMMW